MPSDRAALTGANTARHERVMAELVACYGEGEDTDWPYLNDLAHLIVGLIEKEAAADRTRGDQLRELRDALVNHVDQTDDFDPFAWAEVLNEIVDDLDG